MHDACFSDVVCLLCLVAFFLQGLSVWDVIEGFQNKYNEVHVVLQRHKVRLVNAVYFKTLVRHILEGVYKSRDGVFNRVPLNRLGSGYDVVQTVACKLLLLKRLLSGETVCPVSGRHVAGSGLEAHNAHEEWFMAEALRDLDDDGRVVDTVRDVSHLDALPPPGEVETSAAVEHQVGDLIPLAWQEADEPWRIFVDGLAADTFSVGAILVCVALIKC